MKPFRKAAFGLILIVAFTTSGPSLVAVSRSTFKASTQDKPSLNGNWNGLLEVSGTKLRLVLKLRTTADGLYVGTVDSLDQMGGSDLKIDTIVFKESSLHFEMQSIRASYDGEVNKDRNEIVGSWKQGGAAVTLIFRREDQGTKSIPVFSRGRLKLEPCNLPKLTQDARCGKYEVYEDRAAARGRKIALNILIMPARADKPARDPVFFLAGGPGQSAVSVVTEGGDFLTGIRDSRDIVFIDQRGTGQSNPLDCAFRADKNDMRGYFSDPNPADVVRTCRSELEKVANPVLYTTGIAMDDLDEVRAALGYDRINLLGGSYGTNAALVYLRQHPKTVRTLVLKGVAPTDYKMPLAFSKGVQHAMDRLMDDCAADATCQRTFPTLRTEFVEVLARLDKAPVLVGVQNLVTNQPQQVTITRAAFVDSLRLMLYVPELTGLLPLIIHHAFESDFAPFAAYAFLLARQIDPQIARGMQLSVICSEHVPFITEADIARETVGTYYGDVRIRSFQDACRQWPSVRALPGFVEPVKSDIPVLMVSGDVDPVTPASIATAAARFLPNSLHVIIRDGTHLTESPCIRNLISEFISNGSGKDLDTTCVNDIKRPPFIYRFPISFKPAGK